MANSGSLRRGALVTVAGAALLAALSMCDLPFSLGQPTTRALENGAAGTLGAATSFEIKGSYTESADQSALPSPPASSVRVNLAGAAVNLDLVLVRPATEHVLVTGSKVNVEAIVLDKQAYFRGQDFLSQHMGSDPLSRNLVKAAGNAWWKGSAGLVPQLPDFTNGSNFRSTFLGPAVTQRTDRVSVDGIDAIDLSGPRADVFIAAASPYQVLRVHLKNGVTIDGLVAADFRFENFNQSFTIAAPTDVIDFSNLSTLPPIYTVVSVDASGCGSPCTVSALLKNLGGLTGASAPSTITFTMTDAASGKVLATCQTQVKPDVGYNATTTVSCTMSALSGQQVNAATVTATANNPGRG